ncbi:LLM class flavin-dependent oxidoreductase [Streptomyces clavuligerus]|uniref:Flavin dependent oxidoreductase n=1 Tax=Streptomyces clavuligerus TaxID=1901 RepID=B5GU24_STRCL|nr:LLM class flavin-dependent oxidoreductase [Streptomyces clavuligerus]ANW21365.1 luciferase [Streptomyces clavuligerus]AXU15992.1 LLM class flavin-dependent oxidoreductase [Streptomyces clavuligerus]EDY49820.1 flavin dependant oxidoreductase [Streptomyces clavuligerus]EFG05499.1 Flavin dependent oxidoreductase [Streptomyces clavuligerus]MBY6306127.1 LLM class flavin-dependent oxidoreductase [Streptomyces clavuligerus]
MRTRTTNIPLSVLDLSPIRHGHGPAEALANTVELARAIEAYGYHRFWISEHHNTTAMASSATSIMIGRVAAATERIRVGAGGVMLPNHAPYVVAEQFGTLAAYHPGRIDLGLGRAPGTDPWTTRALRRDHKGGLDFPEQVAELRGYLAPGDGKGKVRAIPGEGSDVPVYILGSSTFGAALAAREGLPFVHASHFSPDRLDEALERYRAEYRPSAAHPEPYAIVAANAVVADTEKEAVRTFSTLRQKFLTHFRGEMRILPPVDDIDRVWAPQEAQMVNAMLRESFVGTPDTVRAGLEDLAERTGADELMIVSEAWDFATRLRSYELLARTWNL